MLQRNRFLQGQGCVWFILITNRTGGRMNNFNYDFILVIIQYYVGIICDTNPTLTEEVKIYEYTAYILR